MARDEHDREDLLAEATALPERVTITLAGGDEPLFAGFRRDGGASFYLGANRVYQFNSTGQLRRAFVAGLLYKAELGRLVSLDRHRSLEVVELIRHELTDVEQHALLEVAQRDLDTLGKALARDDFARIGQVPVGIDVIARVRAWLEQFAGPLVVARSPRAG